MADSAQPKRDGDLARDHAHDRQWDGVGCDALPAVAEELRVLALRDVDATGTTPYDDPGARFTGRQSRIAPRFPCGDHADERGLRVAARVCARDPPPPSCDLVVVLPVDRRRITDGDRWHGRRDAARQRRDIELGDGPNAAAPGGHLLPEPFTPHTERRDDPDSGDDDPTTQIRAHSHV